MFIFLYIFNWINKLSHLLRMKWLTNSRSYIRELNRLLKKEVIALIQLLILKIFIWWLILNFRTIISLFVVFRGILYWYYLFEIWLLCYPFSFILKILVRAWNKFRNFKIFVCSHRNDFSSFLICFLIYFSLGLDCGGLISKSTIFDLYPRLVLRKWYTGFILWLTSCVLHKRIRL